MNDIGYEQELNIFIGNILRRERMMSGYKTGYITDKLKIYRNKLYRWEMGNIKELDDIKPLLVLYGWDYAQFIASVEAYFVMLKSRGCI